MSDFAFKLALKCVRKGILQENAKGILQSTISIEVYELVESFEATFDVV